MRKPSGVWSIANWSANPANTASLRTASRMDCAACSNASFSRLAISARNCASSIAPGAAPGVFTPVPALARNCALPTTCACTLAAVTAGPPALRLPVSAPCTPSAVTDCPPWSISPGCVVIRVGLGIWSASGSSTSGVGAARPGLMLCTPRSDTIGPSSNGDRPPNGLPDPEVERLIELDGVKKSAIPLR